MKTVRAFALCGFGLISAPALGVDTATDHFKRFFSEVQTYEARFEQLVLDEAQQPLERSEGRVWIQRPARFRWDYAPPASQQIVSDGQRVWIYDIDLEQVTVRPFDTALGGSPAELLAGRGDFEDSYVLTEIGDREGLAWVELAPRQDESAFESVRIGFDGAALRVLELLDGLGQVTRIELFEAVENTAFSAGQFDFVAPEGVDVIEDGS